MSLLVILFLVIINVFNNVKLVEQIKEKLVLQKHTYQAKITFAGRVLQQLLPAGLMP